MHQCWHESYGSAAKLLLSHTAAQDKNTSVNRACLSCMVYGINTKSAKMQGFPSLWVSQSLGWLLCPFCCCVSTHFPTSLLLSGKRRLWSDWLSDLLMSNTWVLIFLHFLPDLTRMITVITGSLRFSMLCSHSQDPRDCVASPVISPGLIAVVKRNTT